MNELEIRSKAELREMLNKVALCSTLKDHLDKCDYCLGFIAALFESNRLFHFRIDDVNE